jgi:methionine synthase II (cobalamin-independent)
MVGYTGIGSLPGTDLGAALRMTFDKVSGLPYLPELPARGPWAGMIGRATGILSGLSASYDAGEWRLGGAPGIDQRRARATWRDDLDRLEESAEGYSGPLKIAVTGPWTLAASLFRPLGGRVLGDPSARADLAQSLVDGLEQVVRDLHRRMPTVALTLQLDEPSLPAVLAGRVPTEGGFFRHRAVDRAEAVQALDLCCALGPETVLHCCAPLGPLSLGTGSLHVSRASDGRSAAPGFAAVSLDQDQIADWDALGAAIEEGLTLHLGCLPTAAGRVPGVDLLTRRVLAAVRPLELGPVLADRLVLTPSCGLAGYQPSAASRVFEVLARVAERVDGELRG